MSTAPEFSFAGLNKPWPANHAGASIRRADLLLIAAGIVAWLFVLNAVFGGGTNASNGWASQPEDAFATTVRYGIFLSFAGFSGALLMLWALARVRGYSPAVLGLSAPPTWGYLMIFPVWFLLGQILALTYSLGAGQPGVDALMAVHSDYQAAYQADPVSNFAYWAVVAVLRPLAMAIVFRGWVFGWLRLRMGFWPAALIASALYAASFVGTYDHLLEVSTHFYAATRALSLLIMGMVYCFMTEVSKSIWPAAALAVFTNMMALAAG